MKILNLFAGIGGNRGLWDNKSITAVECDPDIAEIYSARFPTDKVYSEDAIDFLRNHFEQFDFIWASPPCQTHTKLNIANYGRYGKVPEIPDATGLYGIIIFLKKFYQGKFVVENVKPYYRPLIRPTAQMGRHFFWANFHIPEKRFKYKRKPIENITLRELAESKKVDLDFLKSYTISSWEGSYDVYRTLLRNMVDERIGKYILDCAIKPKQQTLLEKR